MNLLVSMNDVTGRRMGSPLKGKTNYPVWAYTMREHLTTVGLADVVFGKQSTESVDPISQSEPVPLPSFDESAGQSQHGQQAQIGESDKKSQQAQVTGLGQHQMLLEIKCKISSSIFDFIRRDRKDFALLNSTCDLAAFRVCIWQKDRQHQT